jgi:hypothetical protein
MEAKSNESHGVISAFDDLFAGMKAMKASKARNEESLLESKKQKINEIAFVETEKY